MSDSNICNKCIRLYISSKISGAYKYFSGFSGAKEVYINTSPAPEKCVKILFRRRNRVYKYFLGLSGAGEVFIYTHLSDTSPAPEKPGRSLGLYIPFRRRRSIFTHFSGAGEVFIYTSVAPEKPDKYLYAPLIFDEIYNLIHLLHMFESLIVSNLSMKHNHLLCFLISFIKIDTLDVVQQ